MIPFLTYPLALIALATLPALAAIYILRNRFRRRQVSSLMLWRFQVQSKAGGAKVHRLQLPLLFFLELLALLLLVVAATGPHWKLPQSTRPLIVVLDDSFSMRAVHDGVSTQERARDYLKKMFQFQPPPSTRLILAGMEPRSLGSSARTWSEVSGLLAGWKCWAPDSKIDAAITLASELGKQQANILVLSDHAPVSPKITNPRLEWHAFGAPVDNIAFVNASRTAFGDEDRCLLEISDFSPNSRSTRLVIRAGTNVLQSSLISLAGRENQRLVFNVPAGTPALDATLEDDALKEDNEVQLLPPIRKRVRVEVSLTNAAQQYLIERTLEATGLRAAISDNPELIIHDHDSVVNSNSWSLCWNSPAEASSFTGPFIVDNSHPLATGIELEGVIWAAPTGTNAPGDVPVILAGNTPLLAVREDFIGRRHLTLNYNPGLSTLQNTPDWPILICNILQWRISEMPGLKESNARLGTDVNLQTTGDSVSLIRPDATREDFPKPGGELALDTPMPGIYSVSMGVSTNQFAVNVLAADKSDLVHCVTGQWGKWSEAAEHRMEEASAVWIFGILALGLLSAHLYLLASSRASA